MNKEIFCTLGPKSLNKKFLENASKHVNLLRLNMSHLSLKSFEKNIKLIRKFSKTPICLDTEGAQIRTKISKKKFFKKNQILRLFNKKTNLKFYPDEIKNLLKKKDLLDIGFEGLKIKIIKKNSDELIAKVVSEGWFESSKGVHLINRSIKLNCLTKKDYKAIKIAKKYKIKNYALSFTNTVKDVKIFNKLLPNSNKIFKLESKDAIKNLRGIIKEGQNFLIDRGDLSKSISLEMIPVAQRKIIKEVIKKKKKVYVATNLLESMIFNKSPTRGEVNDIYNILELGATGLVLAAETAIGNNSIQCIDYLKKIINTFKKYG
jgi:pyruvate kinase